MNDVAVASGRGKEYFVLNNNVQYASRDMRIALMAKMDDRSINYLQQAEELAHFAQEWETGAVNKKIGRKVVSSVQDRRNEDKKAVLSFRRSRTHQGKISEQTAPSKRRNGFYTDHL